MRMQLTRRNLRRNIYAVEAHVKRRTGAATKTAATNDRTFRTFLLVAQLEAEAIGLRIRQARDEAGMTQEELADVARGFSKRSLQDYEAGVTIPYKHMQEIAAITGKEVEWILHGDPEQPREGEAVAASVLDRLRLLEETVARIDEQTAQGFRALEAAIGQLAERLQPPEQAGSG